MLCGGTCISCFVGKISNQGMFDWHVLAHEGMAQSRLECGVKAGQNHS